LPTTIYELNRMPEEERSALLSLLVPARLFSMFTIDPRTFRNRSGKVCVKFTCPDEMPFFQIDVRRDPADTDAAYFLDVSTSAFGQMEISFIIVNDPDGERFGIDRTKTGTRRISGPRGGTCRRNFGRWRPDSRRGRCAGACG